MTTREGTVTYRYDELHRLTEACWSPTSCPGGPPAPPLACLTCIGGLLTRPPATTTPPPGETYRTYTYDPVGNRLTEASNAGTTSYANDAADRLTTVTPPGGGPISYGFDNNGNQTAAGGTSYTYDYADRLQSATVGGTTETYTYAGDGVRLSASTGAQPNQSTKFVWDRVFGLPQLVIERDGNDSVLRAYRYGLDLVNQSAGGSTSWYHHDGLGSVADVTGASATSLAWSEYYPYGVVRLAGVGAGAPAVNPFAFTGEQLDGVTGLYHLRARQYDPGTGRFLTTDPLVGPISGAYVAAYVYVHDGPLGYVDPSGLAGEPSNTSGLTVGWCVMAGGGAGAFLTWTGCVLIGDWKLAFAGSVASGATLGVTASLGTGPIWSSANEPAELSGASLIFGGSGGEGIGGGFDQYFGYKSDVTATFLWGGVTAKTPLPPAEGHFGAGGTWVSPATDLEALFRGGGSGGF